MISETTAIKELLANGWQTWYPLENLPLSQQYFWDGKNHKVGYSWFEAYEEMHKRKQLSFNFQESK
jgi:hypothetical protein